MKKLIICLMLVLLLPNLFCFPVRAEHSSNPADLAPIQGTKWRIKSDSRESVIVFYNQLHINKDNSVFVNATKGIACYGDSPSGPGLLYITPNEAYVFDVYDNVMSGERYLPSFSHLTGYKIADITATQEPVEQPDNNSDDNNFGCFISHLSFQL